MLHAPALLRDVQAEPLHCTHRALGRAGLYC